MADFIEYRKTIQKLVQEEKLASLIDLLQVLMEQKITPNDLKESQIGIAVGKLRKHTDAKVKRHSRTALLSSVLRHSQRGSDDRCLLHCIRLEEGTDLL